MDFGFNTERKWGDIMVDSPSNSLSGAPKGRTELDMLADESRAGVNLMFKQAMQSVVEASSAGEAAPAPTKNAWGASRSFPAAASKLGISSPGRKRDLQEMAAPSATVAADSSVAGRKSILARRSAPAAIFSPPPESMEVGPAEIVTPEPAGAAKAAGITRQARVRSAVSFAVAAGASATLPPFASLPPPSGAPCEGEGEGDEDAPSSFLLVEQGKGKKRRMEAKATKPRSPTGESAAPKAAAAAAAPTKPAGRAAFPLASTAVAPWARKAAAAAPAPVVEAAAPEPVVAPQAVAAMAVEVLAPAPAPIAVPSFSWASLSVGSKTAPAIVAPAVATPAEECGPTSWRGLFASPSPTTFGAGSGFAAPGAGAAPAVEDEEEEEGKEQPEELTEKKLVQRQRQIELGYATPEYIEYATAVPRASRRHIAAHPATPDRFAPISKRRFTGQVKAWRKALHVAYPVAAPAAVEAAEAAEAVGAPTA